MFIAAFGSLDHAPSTPFTPSITHTKLTRLSWAE